MNDKVLPHDHGSKGNLIFLQKQVEEIDKFRVVAEVFKQLGDTSRIRIFWLLCHCEQCVTNISGIVNMTSPAVSHHLRLLKENGLIEAHREGKEVYYKASDTEQSRILHMMIESIMEITCPVSSKNSAIKNDPTDTIKNIHEYLLANLDKRVPIEAIAREYLMNTTTLKSTFKSVYGDSIAAHMKEHRMKKAALLLQSTEDSIADIARAVGYESQSRFTAAFKEFFSTSPSSYRKSFKD